MLIFLNQNLFFIIDCRIQVFDKKIQHSCKALNARQQRWILIVLPRCFCIRTEGRLSLVAFYDKQDVLRAYANPGPQGT